MLIYIVPREGTDNRTSSQFLRTPQWPCLWGEEKCAAEQPLLFSRALCCYRRCENLSVKCLLVLIIKVTECLTFDRWQIIGEHFRNTALLGTNFWEEVTMMWWKRYGEQPLKRYHANSHNREGFQFAQLTTSKCHLQGFCGHPHASVTRSFAMGWMSVILSYRLALQSIRKHF